MKNKLIKSKKLIKILIGISFSFVSCSSITVEPPSDKTGFCTLFLPTLAECTPVQKGVLQDDKAFTTTTTEMIGYTAMSPEFNGKIQLYIEDLKKLAELSSNEVKLTAENLIDFLQQMQSKQQKILEIYSTTHP